MNSKSHPTIIFVWLWISFALHGMQTQIYAKDSIQITDFIEPIIATWLYQQTNADIAQTNTPHSKQPHDSIPHNSNKAQSNTNQNSNTKADDTLSSSTESKNANFTSFMQTPQVQLIELTKAYQKEHFTFLTTLENLATTQEQKTFVRNYEKFLRMILLHSLVIFYTQDESIMLYFLRNERLLQKGQWEFEAAMTSPHVSSLTRSYLRSFLQSLQDSSFHTKKETFIKNCTHKEQTFLESLEQFFRDQKQFVESFGKDFFVFLDSYTPRTVCIEDSCGHPTELFVLENTFNRFQTPNNKEHLEKIRIDATRGYKFYIMLKSGIGNMNLEFAKGFTKFWREYVKSSDSDREEIAKWFLQEFEYEEDNQQYLDRIMNFWSHIYLTQLYSGKYIIALEANIESPITSTNTQSHKQDSTTHIDSNNSSHNADETQQSKSPLTIIKDSMRDGFAICLNTDILSKKAQEVCNQYYSMPSLQSQLPDKVLGNTQFMVLQKQNCLSMHYTQEKDTLFLVIHNNKTNTNPTCQALQKKAMKLASKEVYKLHTEDSDTIESDKKESIQHSFTKDQENALKLIHSPLFAEYITLLQNNSLQMDSTIIQNLCESKNPLACAVVGDRSQDMAMLKDSCKKGAIQACDTLINNFLNMDFSSEITHTPQEFMEISQINCEIGGFEACSLVGKMLLHVKNFDFVQIPKDRKKGLLYLKKGCEKGGGLGCMELLENIEEASKLGLLSGSKDSFRDYACNKLDFAPKDCDGNAKGVFQAKEIYYQKWYVEKGTFTHEDMKFFETVCKNASNEICTNLITVYYTLYGDNQKDMYMQKREWAAKIACNRDDASGCMVVANLKQLPEESLPFYQKSCDVMPWQMGYVSPFSKKYSNYKNCEITADSYNLGLGVIKNADMAKIYYFKACMNGSQDSCHKLSIIIR